MVITLFYRDGGNNKFTVDFPISYDQLAALAQKRGKGLETGEEIEYTDLGITQDQFHEKTGYAYDDDIDHPFVTVEGIRIPSRSDTLQK